MVPGQVWWIKGATVGAVGHEMKGDRYWMVLSDAGQNQHTGLVTFAPLHKSDIARYSTDIGYTRANTNDSVVLQLNQIQTLDVNDKQYKFNYIYTVVPAVLECVRSVLAKHFGISTALPSLSELEALLTQMVDRAFARTHASDVVNNVKALIEEKIADMADVDEEEAEDPPPLEEEPPEDDKPQRRDPGRKIKWTKELCKEFLNDMETKDAGQVMEKWNILTRQRLSQRRLYVEGCLRKMIKKEKES